MTSCDGSDNNLSNSANSSNVTCAKYSECRSISADVNYMARMMEYVQPNKIKKCCVPADE